MAQHWEILLEAIVDSPQQSIYKLPFITTTEIEQFKIWNQTDIDYPKEQTLVTLFEYQVTKNPDNIAIVFKEQSLSYQQLNEKANQLANYLSDFKKQHQLPDNSLIGICVDLFTGGGDREHQLTLTAALISIDITVTQGRF